MLIVDTSPESHKIDVSQGCQPEGVRSSLGKRLGRYTPAVQSQTAESVARELAAIYDTVPGILFYIAIEPGDEYRFVSMSRAGLVAMGLRRDQVEGMLVRDVIPPPSRDVVLDHYREAIRSGGTVRWTEVSEYPAGQRVGEVAVTAVRDQNGVATHLIGIVHDITERQQLEEALWQREQRERLALEASAGGSWTWDAQTNQIDWDDRFRAIYGFAPEDSPSFEGWLDRVHHDDRPHVLALLDEIMQTRRLTWSNTFRIERTDGSVLWIQSQGRAVPGGDGKIVRLTGLELDVTERRLIEEDAFRRRRDQEHESELRQLLETAAQGVVSVDTTGRIVTANHALETMFGWQAGELLGQPIEVLIPPALRDGHSRHRHEYFSTPHPRLMGGGLDLVGQRKDGSTFPIEVSLNHVGEPERGRVFAFVTDTTERRRAARALAERTAELERRTFQLSRMASDLTLAEQRARGDIAKTLHDGLQQILVIARLNLEQQLTRDAEEGKASELVRSAADNLAQAIEAARSLSIDLFPPVLHHAGLPTALQWLANWAGERYGLAVELTVDPHADSPRKDVRTLLFESVRELLFNAMKHARADRVQLALQSAPDGSLHITVADDGAGFDAATLIEPTGGAPVGWGLFSIRERLALLGGQFTIDSSPSRGARFQLIAPPGSVDCLDDAAPSVGLIAGGLPPDSLAPELPLDSLRILVVDDHPAVRRVLCETLHQWPGLRVVGEAATGLEAIAQVHRVRPDVVLMDVSMPVMDGTEATRHIRAAYPSIEILALSMQGPPGDVHPIEDAGAAGFFVKGVDTQRLIDRLLQALANRRDRAKGLRVLIADDYEPIALALKRALSVQCDVIGIVADGHAVVGAVTALRPDVVIVDVNLPGVSGLDACREITRTDAHPKVIVITGLPDPELKALALAAGASAFVSKSGAFSELLAAVNQVTSERNR